MGFSIEEDADAPAGKHARRVTKRTTQAIAMLLLPVSLLMVSSVSWGLLSRRCAGLQGACSQLRQHRDGSPCS